MVPNRNRHMLRNPLSLQDPSSNSIAKGSALGSRADMEVVMHGLSYPTKPCDLVMATSQRQ